MRADHPFFRYMVLTAVALLSSLPAKALCTLPYNLTNGQTADATQVMANFNALLTCVNNASPAGPVHAVQTNAGNGQLGAVGPLTNGQLVIGSTGAAPQAQALTAGSGISIANTPGSITISATGGGGSGSGLYGQVMSATPTVAATGLSNWLNQRTAFTNDTQVGLALTMPAAAGNGLSGRYMAAPTTPYTITALIAVTRNTGGYSGVGLGWYDGTNQLHILNYMNNGGNPQITVEKWSNPTTFNSFDVRSAGSLGQPVWFQLQDDGTTVTFSYAYDGVSFLPIYSIAKASGFLGANGYSNIIFFVTPINSDPVTIGTIMSWKQS